MKSTAIRAGGTCIQWIFSLAVIYVVWRWLLTPHLSPLLFAGPEKVWGRIEADFRNGTLWSMVGITLRESVAGLVIGSILGIVVAVLIGVMPRRFGDIFEPIIGGFYAMPKFVLAPLLFIWLGTDFTPRVVLVTISVFPLVAIYSLTGVRTVDPNVAHMMRLAGASRRQIAQKLVAPHTAGYFAVSLVLATPHALTVAVGAEILFGATTGIGGSLYHSSELFQPADVLAALVVGTVLALILFGISRLFERRLLASRGQLVAGRSSTVTL
jgi:NitT/TauT family transport system permease protein